MARTLWLLRHAKTVTDPPPGKTDHDRRLAPRGRRDADALAKRLGDGGDRLGLTAGRKKAVLPELVLCSTSTRTRQTTERVLATVADPPPVDYRRALYNASPEKVLGELSSVDDAVLSVMLVGHNPTFTALAIELAAPADFEKAGLDHASFPTTALAVYRFPVTSWGAVAFGTGALLGLFSPPY